MFVFSERWQTSFSFEATVQSSRRTFFYVPTQRIRFDFVAIWKRDKLLKNNIRLILNSSEKCFFYKRFFSKIEEKQKKNIIEFSWLISGIEASVDITREFSWETNDYRKIFKKKKKNDEKIIDKQFCAKISELNIGAKTNKEQCSFELNWNKFQ